MARIKCPDCGKQISDKAEKCIYCGNVLKKPTQICCLECGTELEKGTEVCPVCGCTITDVSENMPQKVEVTGVKVNKRVRKIITVGVIVVIIIISALIIGNRMKMARENSNAQKRSEEYSADFERAAYTMLTGAGDAESCGNLIKQVWYNAIYQERDEKTNKYTMPNGYFISDFNEALKNLFADTSFSRRINSIEKNQETLTSLMKKLKNPPEEYKDAYASISELYNVYLTLTNLVISPTGSLQTFSADFNSADNDTLNCYNAMEVYLED